MLEVTRPKLQLKYVIFQWLWLIILFPKQVQLTTFGVIALFMLHKKNRNQSRTLAPVAMLMLSSVHLFSIVYNILALHTGEGRIVASINTLLLWPIAAIIMRYYEDTDVDILVIGKYCYRNILFLFIAAVIAVIMYYGRHIPEVSVWGDVLYETRYLKNSATIRFFGFNDFTNMNLFYILINYMMSISFLKKKSGYMLISVAILAFEIILIHSRAGIMLLIFSVMLLYYSQIPTKYRKLVLTLAAASALLYISANGRIIYDSFTASIINADQSSNQLRILLLRTSIDEAWHLSPVWGMGIKRYLVKKYPLGSHSTYVGFFYKTGFLGVLLGFYIMMSSNKFWLEKNGSNKNFSTMAGFLISFIVLLAIEDIDGTNWSIIIYFSVLAILRRSSMMPRNRNIGRRFS